MATIFCSKNLNPKNEKIQKSLQRSELKKKIFQNFKSQFWFQKVKYVLFLQPSTSIYKYIIQCFLFVLIFCDNYNFLKVKILFDSLNFKPQVPP